MGSGSSKRTKKEDVPEPKVEDNAQQQDADENNPLFAIGIIADPQYADVDDGQNYLKDRTRRYRQALKLTINAVNTWNDETKCKVRPSMIMFSVASLYISSIFCFYFCVVYAGAWAI